MDLDMVADKEVDKLAPTWWLVTSGGNLLKNQLPSDYD